MSSVPLLDCEPRRRRRSAGRASRDARRPAALAPATQLELRLRRNRPTATVEVSGELDLCSAPQLNRRFAALLANARVTQIVLDLDAVTFIDAAGLRAIVGCGTLCRQNGVRLDCRIPSRGPVHRLVELVDGLASNRHSFAIR